MNTSRAFRCVVVFWAVLALVPCLPGVPAFVPNAKQVWAANLIIDGATTTRQNITGNLNITNGGSLSVSRESAWEGGAVSVRGTVFVEGTGFVNLTHNNAEFTGGAISASHDPVTLSNAADTFIDNSAGSNGGAIVAKAGNVILSGTGSNTFTANTAAAGGAIAAERLVTLSNAANTFTDNSASSDGGAIYTRNGNVTITGGTNTFRNNKSCNGGAICTSWGSVFFNGTGTTTFENNTALRGRSLGGGVWAHNDIIISNTANTFTGNKAGNGGALYSATRNVILSDGTNTFTDNSAGTIGGAICAVKTANIGGNATFVNNEAGYLGGAIFAMNQYVPPNANLTFTGNRAKKFGGALYASSDAALSGNVTFTGNTATQGGAIYAERSIILSPGSNEAIRFVTPSDTLYAGNSLIMNGTGVVEFNASNTIDKMVQVHSGEVRLTQASTFHDTPLHITGGTLYMGEALAGKTRTAAFSPAYAAPAYALVGAGMTGAGSRTSYATNLRGFFLGDNAVLALGMNTRANAAVPYFTLAPGYAATSGQNSTVHGVIGPNLTSVTGRTWTYTLFSGSNGAEGAFAPAHYTTSNTLVSLANPTYSNGTFTLDVVRSTVPDPNPAPDPGGSTPFLTGDFMGLFPDMSLQPDMEMILYYDYLYNGGTIANPGPGTLIGQNAFFDQLFFVYPGGQHALSKQERHLALMSAASMADLSGSLEMLRDTGNRLRGQIFSAKPVLAEGGLAATFGPDTILGDTGAAVTLGEDTRSNAVSGNRVGLWAVPLYSHESGKNRGMYGGYDSGYTFNLYGGTLGLDALFGDGRFRTGIVFTVGHGKLDSTGDNLKTTNSADYYGGALFGAWRPAPEWEIGSYAGYITQENDVEQGNILPLQSDFDTKLWQFGANARYTRDIGNNGKRKLTANVGADVQLFRRDSAGIQFDGKDVGKLSKADLNQVQLPLTVGIEDTFEFESSTLTLKGHAGARFTLGDLAAESDWSIPGGSYRASIKGPDADRATGLAGVGAVWRKDNLSLGIGYDAELGSKRTNHQVSGQLKWSF